MAESSLSQPKNLSNGDLPSPEFGTPWRISPIWLLPVIAAVIGLGLAYQSITNRGPTVTLLFKSAEGLTAGKSKIRYKNVEIGKVKDIQISADLSNVVVRGEMDGGTERYLREGSRFWVVRPRLSLTEVSGMGALVSGAYIAVDPGNGEESGFFTGLEEPPVVNTGEAGRKFLLKASNLGSISLRSPVYHRGFQVGEVLGYALAKDQQSMDVHIFVRQPYDHLVRENSRFWNAGGVSVTVGTEGMKIKTESLQTLMSGGVAFETPKNLESSNAAQNGQAFTLYPDYEAIEKASYTQKLFYLLYFEDSVRGLSVGAPVEFRGIQIGSVTDIRMNLDSDHLQIKIPVLIRIEPERFAKTGPKETDRRKVVEQMVAQGLRAQLKMGSLLTGQLFVDMGFYPDRPAVAVNNSGTYPELPTIPSDLKKITGSVSSLLNKLNNFPLEQTLEDLHQAVSGARQFMDNPQLVHALENLNNTLMAYEVLARNLDGELKPLTKELTTVATSASAALNQIEATVKNANGMIDPGSPVHAELVSALREISNAARGVRTLTESLERNPEGLLFGRGNAGRK